MTSTTLMTFLLHTRPDVRSVKLLGSWDNFSKPYSMERDWRVGQGQWRGCHTFTNIVCDGSPAHLIPARSGGLKMGGTYWYYYLLDNDIEHYNEAEPVTTHCPFLPGQPLNVLHVPVIFPDTRPMHTFQDSPSYRKADVRTMNPEDKYMNPRQPPKPKLPRLRTSPPLLQQPTSAWSFNISPLGALTNRAASQPSSSGNQSPRSSGSKPARSVSPPRSRGLRAAFRHLNVSSPDLSSARHWVEGSKPLMARIPGLSSTGDGGKVCHGFVESAHRDASNTTHIRPHEQMHQAEDLLFRRPASTGNDSPVNLSIQNRRAMNTKSMEHLSCRSPLTLETQSGNPPTGEKGAQSTFSLMAAELLAALNSPSFLKTAKPVSLSDVTTPTPFTYMDKRLPTLPNTPSSVMNEALRDIDARERNLDTENLGSHFSDFTETDGSCAGSLYCERSHFSEWSTDTELISPESMTSSSTLNVENHPSPNPGSSEFSDSLKPSVASEFGDPNTPHLTVNSKPSPPSSIAGDSPQFDLPLPRLTISLSPSDFDIAGLGIDDLYNVERDPKRHAAFFGAMESIKDLGISPSPSASAMQFPDDVRHEIASPSEACDTSKRLSHASTCMLETMDEFSYLRHMIRSGTGDDV